MLAWSMLVSMLAESLGSISMCMPSSTMVIIHSSVPVRDLAVHSPNTQQLPLSNDAEHH